MGAPTDASTQKKKRLFAASDCQKTSTGGVGGPAGPLTAIVSRGFAARAGRFRHHESGLARIAQAIACNGQA